MLDETTKNGRQEIAQATKSMKRLWKDLTKLMRALDTCDESARDIVALTNETFNAGSYTEEYLEALQALDRDCKNIGEIHLTLIEETMPTLLDVSESDTKILNTEALLRYGRDRAKK